MATAWQPQPAGLSDLLNCLKQTQAADSVVQAQVRERIDQFQNVPDYSNYLIFVLSSRLDNVNGSDRAAAGYLLTSNIRRHFERITPASIEYIKSTVFAGLDDPDPEVRKATANVISWLFKSLSVDAWPEALTRLLTAIEGVGLAQETAYKALFRLCEDVPRIMERSTLQGQPVLDFMVPRLLQHLSSDSQEIRQFALQCLVPFISQSAEPNALFKHMPTFLSLLFKRASDDSITIRKFVCRAMVGLLSATPDVLLPEIRGVVDYILHCTQSSDHELALEACEFWLTFAESNELSPYLKPFIGKIAPVLLNTTVYDEDELFNLGAYDEEDEAVPDKAQDIKPRHHESKAHAQEHDDPEGLANGKSANAGVTEEDDEDEEGLEDDDDEDYQEWTLRKCSAAALDVMAVTFENDLLVILLPHLKEKLWSQDWSEREAGILALGAIAEGCIDGLQEHLPILINYLVQTLNDAKPLVRSIACWALGRYSGWCISPGASEEHKRLYFVPVMEGLLRMVLDNNKRVQEAGCSAFATLEEEAAAALEPYLAPILRNLVFAFSKYQQKNLMILYDAIGTLADAVGPALNNPELIEVLMPSLIAKWQKLPDDDPDLIPLLECMSSVVIAIGAGFLAFAAPVFQRCMHIIHTSLRQYNNWQVDPANYEEPDRTFLVVALDLLSGLTQGLGTSISSLYESSSPPVFTLLSYAMHHPEPPVRQSAYALLGDCAIQIFPLLQPHLRQIMSQLVEQILPEPKPDVISVCNNAAWSAGEVALKFGEGMQPYVPPLMERLVPILLNPKAVRSLNENSAVTIGRLGLVCPALVAPHLPVFGTNWCQALAEIKDNDEKDSAFRGICMVIQANPNGLTESFPYFLNAVGRWQKPSPELNEMFRSILNGFKQMSGASWEPIMTPLPPVIRSRLRERYGV